jgi:hypothetical protein
VVTRVQYLFYKALCVLKNVLVEAVPQRRNIRVKRKSFSLALRKFIIFALSEFLYPTLSIAILGGGKNTGISILDSRKPSSGGGSGIGSDIIIMILLRNCYVIKITKFRYIY